MPLRRRVMTTELLDRDECKCGKEQCDCDCGCQCDEEGE